MEKISAIQMSDGHSYFSENKLERVNRFGGFIFKDAFNQCILGEVHEAMRSVFTLPNTVKSEHLANKAVDPLSAGYSPFGRAKALDTGIPNLLETWDINGKNKYWPNQLNHELQIIESFQNDLLGCALASLNFLSNIQGLEILKDTIFQESLSSGIHLIHYFPISHSHQREAVRQSVHKDNTLITLIPKACPEDSPLVVRDNITGDMALIKTKKTECLVQFGTALQILSKGAISPCIHTVRDPRKSCEKNVSRYSTPYFVAPNENFEVKINSPSGIPNTIRFGDLSNEYFQAIFGDSDD